MSRRGIGTVLRGEGSSISTTKRTTIHLPDQPLPALRTALADRGCLNPVERANELAQSGQCRYYRVAPDEAIVTVILDPAP